MLGRRSTEQSQISESHFSDYESSAGYCRNGLVEQIRTRARNKKAVRIGSTPPIVGSDMRRLLRQTIHRHRWKLIAEQVFYFSAVRIALSNSA